ncbi:MAG TPA: cytochrome b/b6 domain-containing protein [Usitatibacter sp.]|nr:cytochrome b/b6 domain-containing protein [Usitatibacter sp.]
MQRKRIWDAPLRLAHWTFVACVAGAWLTRGGEHVDLHVTFGYIALALLIVRIAWGFVGPSHARFRSFVYSPRTAWHYVRAALAGSAPHYTGHNPAGSWAVWTLLALLALVTSSGIVASAAMHGMGPLAGMVPFTAAGGALEFHEAIAWIVLGVAALHIAGVAWGSRVHRENLALAMVTGRKRDHDGTLPEAPRRAAAAAAIALAGVLGTAAYLGWHVPREVARRDALAKGSQQALAETPWSRECGSCHLAYSPSLLPLRSWERTLREQDRHFGEDLSLSPAASQRLLAAAIAPPDSWAAWSLSSSAPAAEAPLRVTGLPAWKRLHLHVPEERFKPPNTAGPHECDACHRDAASGIFHARMIQSAKPRNRS